jgi:hypothetical protein
MNLPAIFSPQDSSFTTKHLGKGIPEWADGFAKFVRVIAGGMTQAVCTDRPDVEGVL